MNLKKELSTNVILLVISGLVVILLVVLSIKRFNHIREASIKIESAKNILNENEERLKRLEILENSRPELEYALQMLSGQIPEDPYESMIIDEIDSFTRQNDADFVHIQFLERAENVNLVEMPVKLTFKGQFGSLVKLIKNLSNGKRLFRIDEINITKSEGNNGLINAELSAFAFCEK